MSLLIAVEACGPAHVFSSSAGIVVRCINTNSWGGAGVLSSLFSAMVLLSLLLMSLIGALASIFSPREMVRGLGVKASDAEIEPSCLKKVNYVASRQQRQRPHALNRPVLGRLNDNQLQGSQRDIDGRFQLLERSEANLSKVSSRNDKLLQVQIPLPSLGLDLTDI